MRKSDLMLAVVVTAASLLFAARLLWDDGYTLQKPQALMTVSEFLVWTSLDINSATVPELCEFDGVDFGIAGRIVAYRDARGGFSSVEELLEVKGVGEKRYRAMLPYICCGSAVICG